MASRTLQKFLKLRVNFQNSKCPWCATIFKIAFAKEQRRQLKMLRPLHTLRKKLEEANRNVLRSYNKHDSKSLYLL